MEAKIYKGPILVEGKSIGFEPKKAHDLKNQDAKLRTKARSNSRIQFGFK
jgi:hypothetical protein